MASIWGPASGGQVFEKRAPRMITFWPTKEAPISGRQAGIFFFRAPRVIYVSVRLSGGPNVPNSTGRLTNSAPLDKRAFNYFHLPNSLRLLLQLSKS